MPLKMTKTPRTLGRQLVREVRQRLAAAAGDEREVLEPHAAIALSVGARLERDDVAGDQLVVAGAAEARVLVHVQADAVAETVEEAVAKDRPRLLRALRRVPRGLVHVTGRLPDGLPARPGARRAARRLEP